ncbi:MAG: hypothetical protein IJ150_00600 [Bacteroidales bacterium]|nr:hypothetical protein [Bacteroidales bacterium]
MRNTGASSFSTSPNHENPWFCTSDEHPSFHKDCWLSSAYKAPASRDSTAQDVETKMLNNINNLKIMPQS